MKGGIGNYGVDGEIIDMRRGDKGKEIKEFIEVWLADKMVPL